MIKSPWHKAPAPEDVPPAPPKKEGPEGTVEVHVFHENPAQAVAAFRQSLKEAAEISERMEKATAMFGDIAEGQAKRLRQWLWFTRVNLVVFGIYIGLSLFNIFH